MGFDCAESNSEIALPQSGSALTEGNVAPKGLHLLEFASIGGTEILSGEKCPLGDAATEEQVLDCFPQRTRLSLIWRVCFPSGVKLRRHSRGAGVMALQSCRSPLPTSDANGKPTGQS